MAICSPTIILPNLPDGVCVVQVVSRNCDFALRLVPTGRAAVIETDRVRAAGFCKKRADIVCNPDWSGLIDLLSGARLVEAFPSAPIGLIAMLNGYHMLYVRLNPYGDRSTTDLPATGEAMARQVDLEDEASRLERSAYHVLKSGKKFLKYELSIALGLGQLQADASFSLERAMSELSQKLVKVLCKSTFPLIRKVIE